MQVFHRLILFAPTSGDAPHMHSTILSIVSSRLEKCFQTLKRRHPNRTDIEPLLQAIANNLNYERSAYPSMTELEQWTNPPSNTLFASLRQTVQQLSQWASAGALQPNPPSYTHKQIYASIKLLGVFQTLRAIVEEVKAQTEAGNGAAALDVGVSLICAPTVENSALPMDTSMQAGVYSRTHTNLREMLRDEFDNAASVIATDPLFAETIVRLHRRVEAQLQAASQAHQIPTTQIDLQNVGMVNVQGQNTELDNALNDAAATMAAAAGGNLQADQQQALEHLASGGGLDLSGMGVGAAGSTNMGDLPDLDLGDMGIGMDLGEDDDAWGLDFDNM